MAYNDTNTVTDTCFGFVSTDLSVEKTWKSVKCPCQSNIYIVPIVAGRI